MINLSYGSEELKDTLEPLIDRLLAEDIFIHVSNGDNIICNAITDPQTGKSCYPDMLLQHNFKEQTVCDSNLYTIADAAIRRYGSSRCYFIYIKDYELLIEFIGVLKKVFKNNLPSLTDKDIALINKFGNDLMLSATMLHSFRNLMTYYAETGGDVYGLLTPFIEEYPLPVTTKQKGKQIYELIRNKVLC